MCANSARKLTGELADFFSAANDQQAKKRSRETEAMIITEVRPSVVKSLRNQSGNPRKVSLISKMDGEKSF